MPTPSSHGADADENPAETEAFQREQTAAVAARAGVEPDAPAGKPVDDAKYGSDPTSVRQLSQAEMDAEVARIMGGS